MRALVGAPLLLGVILTASSARAEGTALVILEAAGARPKLTEAVEAFLVQAATYYPEQKILTGPIARKKLKTDIEKCGVDPACVAQGSAGYKFDAVLLAVVGGGTPTPVEIVTIQVATKSVERRHTFSFGEPSEVQPALARSFFAIAGITTPGTLAIPVVKSVLVDGQPLALVRGQAQLPPGPHLISLNGQEKETIILPNEVRKLPLSDFGLTPKTAAALPGNSPEPPPVAAAPAATPPPPPPDDEPDPNLAVTTTSSGLPPRWLSYVGIGVGTVGLVVTGLGIKAAGNTEVTLSSTTSQRRAAELNREAEDAAKSANTRLAVGGVLVAAGAGLWAYDHFVRASSPSASSFVLPTPGGLVAGVTLATD